MLRFSPVLASFSILIHSLCHILAFVVFIARCILGRPFLHVVPSIFFITLLLAEQMFLLFMSGAVSCLCDCHLCSFHITRKHFHMVMPLLERHHYHVNAFCFSFVCLFFIHAWNYALVTHEGLYWECRLARLSCQSLRWRLVPGSSHVALFSHHFAVPALRPRVSHTQTLCAQNYWVLGDCVDMLLVSRLCRHACLRNFNQYMRSLSCTSSLWWPLLELTC